MATAYDEGAMDLGVLTGTSMSDDMIEIQRNNPYRTEQSTDF